MPSLSSFSEKVFSLQALDAPDKSWVNAVGVFAIEAGLVLMPRHVDAVEEAGAVIVADDDTIGVAFVPEAGVSLSDVLRKGLPNPGGAQVAQLVVRRVVGLGEKSAFVLLVSVVEGSKPKVTRVRAAEREHLVLVGHGHTGGTEPVQQMESVSGRRSSVSRISELR